MPDDVERKDPEPEPTVVSPGEGDNPAPPVEDAPQPEAESLDDRGVPLKNRIAELERKLGEKDSTLQQYQQLLGQFATQAKPPVDTATASDPLESQFDETTRKYVEAVAERKARKIAEETGYKMMSQAVRQTTLSEDSELLKEAQSQYQQLKSNPIWSNADDNLIQEHAVAQAKSVVTERRRVNPAAPGQPVPRNSRPSLPRTGPINYDTAPVVNEKEKYINDFIKQPEYRSLIRKGLTEHGRLDPDSPLGQKVLKELAEDEWTNGSRLTGSVAMAAKAIQSNDPMALQLLGKDK